MYSSSDCNHWPMQPDGRPAICGNCQVEWVKLYPETAGIIYEPGGPKCECGNDSLRESERGLHSPGCPKVGK